MSEATLPDSTVKAPLASPVNSLLNLARPVWQNYYFRTLLQGIFTVWLVMSATFVLMRLMPSNPVQVYVNQQMQYGMSLEEAQSQASLLFSADLDKPLGEQYISFMGRLLRGDLGNSISSPGTTVLDIIATFLPWTLFSIGSALLLSFIIGQFLGLLLAYFRNSPFDFIFTTIASILSSIPNYLIPFFLTYILALQLKIIDVRQMRGAYSPGIEPGFNLTFIQDVFAHALLPILTYLLSTVGTWALSMRNSTLSVLGEEYVNAAHARGLSQGRIITAYVGRNASLPLFMQLATSIAFVVGGSLFIEYTFQYKGIGMRLYEAIQTRDYTVMQGIFLIVTLTVKLSSILGDLVFGLVDPRVRVTRG